MFATAAMAQTTTAAASPPPGLLEGPFGMVIMFAPIIVLYYFLLLRPQQRRQKEHTAMIAGVKRGDTVEMNSGMIGKVTRVEDAEVSVEIARGVEVKVVKSMLSNVRTRAAPAPANDTPTISSSKSR